MADPVVAAGVDRATVLLRAADAAREAGSVERAGELAWSAIDEAFDLGVDRGVEAAGRAWTHLWNANRSYELSALAQERVLPVLDRVEPQARARFLVGYVQHLAINATPKEIRGPATEMIATLDLVDDPVLEARGHMVNAWCHEAYGEFDRVEAEYVRAAELARNADAHAMLVAVLANHAASKQWTPDFEGSIELLDAADELIERYGLSRYRVLVNAMRNVALCLVGELAAAREAVDDFDELHLGGIDRWTRTTCRARVALAAGDYDAAFAELTSVSDAELEDRETILERITMRADALAWLGNLDAARAAVDQGQRALEEHREAYFHGLFALSAMRSEADAAAAASASGSLDQLEEAHERGRAILASWYTTVSELHGSAGIVEAFSLGIDAERARLANESAAEAATRAADRFEAFTMRYHATYFRWRAAEAMLGAGERVAATERLEAGAGGRARTGLRRPGGRDEPPRVDAPVAPRAGAHQRRRRRSALGARVGSAAPVGGRAQQSRDRRGLVRHPPHGGGARVEHPQEARRRVPSRSRLGGAAPRLCLAPNAFAEHRSRRRGPSASRRGGRCERNEPSWPNLLP